MGYAEILMAGIILLTVVIMPVMVPAAWRLMAAVWLAVFQVYTFPVHGFYPSLAFLCSIGLWPELIKHGKELLRWRITQYYFLLLVVQVISLAWSLDVGKGVRLIALMIPFAFILAATIDVIERREDLVRLLVYGALAGAVVEAALVICFRLMPAWDNAFRFSAVAPIFINPNALSPDNISVKRWSAFLVNPNTAAAYLGITSLLAQAVALRYRQWWTALIGAFLALGVIFTKSTGGVVLLGTLYGVGFLLLAWPKLSNQWWRLAVLFAGFSSVLAVLNLDRLTWLVIHSGKVRMQIWHFGLVIFSEYPLRGLGFGGWEVAFEDYASNGGMRKAFAPHNTIIGLWSQSGLIAAILGILFIIGVLIFFWRSRTTPQWREFMICAFLAMVWYFVHQQVDNWGLVNERHIMPIAAVLIGIVYAVSRHPGSGSQRHLTSSPPAEDG